MESHPLNQLFKHIAETLLYAMLAIFMYLLSINASALNEIPLLSDVVSFYNGFAVWKWMEVLISVGFIGLAVISALLAKTNFEQWKQ